MITRTITKGASGSKLKTGEPDMFDAEGARMVLTSSLKQGFEVMNSSREKLVISKYSGSESDAFRNAEYQIFTGPISQMRALLAIAGALKVATTA